MPRVLSFYPLIRHQRGNVAIMTALLMVPLIGVLGLSVDTARAYGVKSQLQHALDAASLAGGRLYAISTRDDEIQAYFNANWKGDRFSAAVSPLSIVQNDATGSLTVSATAEAPTVFMKLLGKDAFEVGATSQVVRNENKLEVALAIDTTGSMGSTDSSGVYKMDAAKNAANLLLNILFNNKDSDDNLFLSVVPFVQNVNVGSNYSNWLESGSTADIPWNAGPYPTSTGWRGCMFERTDDTGQVLYDTLDEPPSTQRFKPYNDGYFGPNCPAWAAGQTLKAGECRTSNGRVYGAASSGTTSGSGPTHTAGTLASGGISWTSLYPAIGQSCELWQSGERVSIGTCRTVNGRIYVAASNGITGATAPTYTTGRPNALGASESDGGVLWRNWAAFWKTGDNFATTGNYRANWFWQYYDNRTTGTSSGTTPPTHTSGTQTVGGNQWRFQGDLTSQLPYNTAEYGYGFNSGCASAIVPMTNSRLTAKARIDVLSPSNYGGTMTNIGLVWAWRTISPRWQGLWSGVASDRPVAYNTPDNYKAVIILTDGENVFNSCGSTFCKGAATPYGYLPDGRLGTTNSGTAVSNLNSKVTEVCSNMRAQGILVYAVMFDLPAGASTTRTLFQNCTGDPNRFFDTVNEAELKSAFETIALDLTRLRISQ